LTTLHYAAGGGLDSQGNFAPAQAGFNLADVQYVDQVNALPDGVQGLVWLDQYQGVTQDFIDQVTPFLNNPKVFGFYLVDEPDLTGEWGPQADPADLKAESDWIHQHDAGAKTFTVLMNTGSSDDPNYMNSYNAANTHIDYFGLDWYPVWSDRSNVDLSTIDKYVSAAEHAGIPLDSIVPVYQAFGGGDWSTETGSKVVMPTAAQEQAMIDHWAQLVPNPAFDYAYAWGSQNGDTALESSPELQQVFLAHNTHDGTSTGGTTAPPIADPVSDTPPVHSGDSTGTGGTTPPVADAGGSTGSTPPVSGSDGTTDPSTGGTTVSGGWGDHHHSGSSGGSSLQTVGGEGLHEHSRGGLDFSQWLNAGTSSPAIEDHTWSRGQTATLTTTADAESKQTGTPDTDSFVAHLSDLMSHYNDHHAWHS